MNVAEDTEDKKEGMFSAPSMAEQERMIEAMIFAATEPVSVRDLEARLPHGCDAAEALVHLRKRYAGRGVHLVRVGDGYAMRTALDLGFLMERETAEIRKLSRAAIETLAIIAYHQPVTRAEIEEIRGVSVSRGTVDQLLEMEWVRFGRRRMTPGRPVTFVAISGWKARAICRVSRSCDLPVSWTVACPPRLCRARRLARRRRNCLLERVIRASYSRNNRDMP